MERPAARGCVEGKPAPPEGDIGSAATWSSEMLSLKVGKQEINEERLERETGRGAWSFTPGTELSYTECREARVLVIMSRDTNYGNCPLIEKTAN